MGDDHGFDFDKQQRMRLMERQALDSAIKKKYFWHIMIGEDKGIFAAIVVNLPAMSGKEYGDYDEQEILELNKIFHKEFDGYKFKAGDTIGELENKVKSQL